MKKREDANALSQAYVELESIVYGISAQDISVPIVQTTREPITEPPCLDAWMDAKRMLHIASKQVAQWKWSLWWLHRIRGYSLRETAQAHNTLQKQQGYTTFISKNKLGRICKQIDMTIEQVMSDNDMIAPR